MLANIYLHELDQFMQGLRAGFDQGQRRRAFAPYTALERLAHRLRREVDRHRAEGADQAKIEAGKAQIEAVNMERRKLPSVDPMDPNFKRLRYCRYADDFLIGIIGSKQEAREIMASVERYLTDTLKLAVAPEKSGVHAASKGVSFLGYRISTFTSTCTGRKAGRKGTDGRIWRVLCRPTTGNVSLRVPRERVTAFCRRHGYGDLARKKGRRREQFTHTSDRNIVLAYNSEFRGFANYYVLADDVKSALGLLELIVSRSFVKTLAMRHRTTTAKIMARLRKGTDYEVSSVVRGEVRSLKLWRLKHLRRFPWPSPIVDVVTKGAWWVKNPNDLIDRLDARNCGICGDTSGPFVMHYSQGDRRWRNKPLTNRTLSAAQRRTTVLCLMCRDDISSCREKPHMENCAARSRSFPNGGKRNCAACTISAITRSAILPRCSRYLGRPSIGR